MIHKIEVPSNTIVYKEIVCHFFIGKVRMKSECFLTYFMLNVFSLTLCWMFSHLLYVECFLTYFMLNVFSLTLCWMFSHLLYVECFLTYFMLNVFSLTLYLGRDQTQYHWRVSSHLPGTLVRSHLEWLVRLSVPAEEEY